MADNTQQTAPDNGAEITAPQPGQQAAPAQQQAPAPQEDEVEEIADDDGDISGSDIESLSEEQINELLAMPEDDDTEEEVTEARPRDEQGRFAPRNPQQAQQQRQQQMPPQEQQFDPANDPRRPPGYVPSAALIQERQAAREATRRARELEGVLLELSQRLMPQPQQQAPQQPGQTQVFDPIESIQRIEERLAAEDARKAQAAQQAEVVAKAEKQVADFAKEFDEDARDNPVLGNAWSYLQSSLAAEWRAFHSDRVPLDRFIKAAIWEHGVTAQRKGQPFSHRVAALAATRGWNPQQARARPQQQQQPQPQQRQQFDPNAYQQATQRLSAIEEQQRRNPSLAGSAGGDTEALSIKAILSMPAEQLEAFARANPKTVERIHQLANGIR